MKYMLLIHGNQKAWDKLGSAWSNEDLRTMIHYMKTLDKELYDSGELLYENGLAGPAAAKTVRAQAGGAPVVADGLHPAEKDFLVGYWVIDVRDEARAVEIAARISATPGPGGAPVNQPVEVHLITGPPPVEEI